LAASAPLQLGLENIEFVQSDAVSLDLPEASFDAVLSRWGIIFEPDAEAAAARIRSFLELSNLVLLAAGRA
jgi:ubiquinone/menaquinone biosynthesis C-methylase UbiE